MSAPTLYTAGNMAAADVDAATYISDDNRLAGIGLQDLTPGGLYTGTVDTVITLECDSTGTPDTFKWNQDGGADTTLVAMTGSAQTLVDGLTITFAATTGHTLGDTWSFKAGVEASGFPKENLLDFNPDTYWKASDPTSAWFPVTYTIDIDLQESKAVEGVIFWLNNYTTDFESGNETITLQSSSDDISYGNHITARDTTALTGAGLTQPIRIADIGSAQSNRYWRIIFATYESIPQISMISLYSKESLTNSPQLPLNDTVRYANQTLMAQGGRVFKRAVNSNSVNILPRSYAIGDTDWTALLASFNDSNGTLRPFILEEGSDLNFVRFASDSLERNLISETFQIPTVTFNGQPYVPDGEVF